MVHKMKMGDDNILRASYIGEVSTEDVLAFQKDLLSFLHGHTEENPLPLLIDVTQQGKISREGRQISIEQNRDKRIGQIAIIGHNHWVRVLATFALKATERDNIRFFPTESEGLDWLQTHEKSTVQ